MADAEKKQLSILETIEAYAGGGEVPAIEMTEEQKKEMTAFLEEEKKKAITSLKKNLSIEETIEAYAGGEKFPKRKITEEQEKEWTAFLEEQRRKDYGEKK